MSTSLAKTKRRLSSIAGTRKLTKAMELIALAKLRRGLSSLDEGRYYLFEFAKALSRLQKMSKEKEGKEKPSSSRRLIVFLGSDLGLCGSYNADLGKMLLSNLRPEDEIYPLGSHAAAFLAKEGLKEAAGLPPLTLASGPEETLAFVEAVLKKIESGDLGEAAIVYSHYANSLKNIPLFERIYPLTVPSPKLTPEGNLLPELDASPEELLSELLLPYLSALLGARIKESSIAECSARRAAMETANDNADELIKQLNVLYNKERQNAITQEIVEVVGGSNV